MKDLSQSEFNYNQAIVIRPNYKQALNNLGLLLTKLERFEQADIVFKRAIMIDPKYISGLINYGNLLHKSGQYRAGNKRISKIFDNKSD